MCVCVCVCVHMHNVCVCEFLEFYPSLLCLVLLFLTLTSGFPFKANIAVLCADVNIIFVNAPQSQLYCEHRAQLVSHNVLVVCWRVGWEWKDWTMDADDLTLSQDCVVGSSSTSRSAPASPPLRVAVRSSQRW